jgi:hypothetical protein
VAVAACLLLLVIAIVPIFRDPLINSWRSYRFRQAIKAIDHPQGTLAVDDESQMGLLVGNSNHCDYYVAQLRSYEGDFAAIESHYETATFFNPVTQLYESPDVARFPTDETFFASELVGWRFVPDDERSLYIVYIFRIYEPNADLRCH